MLYLNPPYYVIDGVSLLPDHVDELQYYFSPLEPHLSTIDDASTGQSIPKIQVIKFAGRSSSTGDLVNGGFLDFDCNLGIEPDRLAEIAEQLRGEAGLSDLPRLAPIPLIGGSVRMMLFGKETPKEDTGLPGRPPSSDEELPGPEFVLKISHYAKPSLYGNNQAAFSVRLDQEGVTILEHALQGELSPIGVVYTLQYVGLRPAHNIRVEADWDRVQTHLEESEKVNVPLIASSQIDEVVDELVEERIITIESDLLVADGDDTSGATGRYEAALNQVRELVFENFFEPSLEPMPRETGDGIDDFGRVMRTIATHGATSFWEKKKVDLTRIDRKRLNINMSERTSVIREIHPQGHLSGIARTIAEQGLDLERFIISVPLDDDFFARRTVRVIPRADFATDMIQSINVSLDYEGDVRNAVFDAATGEQTVEWPSSLESGQMRADVTVSSEVTFGTAAIGRPRTIVSKPETIRGEVVEISPRADIPYELRWVAFNVVDFPWDLYHTAEVHCEYIDEANGIDIRNQYGLTNEQHTGAWPVFAIDPAKRTVRYRLIHHGYDGRDWESDWLETDDDQIRIGDPFSNRLSVDIVVPTALFTTQLDRAFVDVSYDDPSNDVHKRESFELSAQDSSTKRFTVELLDPARREVTFKVSMILADGSVVDIPESTTAQNRILVSPQMRGHRTVRITTDGGDLEAAGIRSIRVETLYERADAGLRFAGDVTLTATNPRGSFEFDFATDAQYQYRVTHQFANGLSRDTGWVPGSAPEIVAEVR
jgi:hypothetical protein